MDFGSKGKAGLVFLAFRRAFLEGGTGALMSTESSARVLGGRFRFFEDDEGKLGSGELVDRVEFDISFLFYTDGESKTCICATRLQFQKGEVG